MNDAWTNTPEIRAWLVLGPSMLRAGCVQAELRLGTRARSAWRVVHGETETMTKACQFKH
jgi:hypothetical protein